MKDNRNYLIDGLRGIAALGVCLFHLLGGTVNYGWLAVVVFFVISGYIIPYSLHKSRPKQYSPKNYFQFLLKRSIRLHPAFIITILTILLIKFSIGPKAILYPISNKQIVLNSIYAGNFFGSYWIDPVFWTLGLELQYYVLIGLTFKLISSERFGWPIAFALLFCDPLECRIIFKFLPIFAMGILAFQYRAKIITLPLFMAGVAGGFAAMIIHFSHETTVVATCVSIFIALVDDVPGTNPITFLGDISYSLYLMHYPVGVQLHHLGYNVPICLAASLGAAYVLYKLVEVPSQKISSLIKYT